MKKILVILMIFAMLCGCSQKVQRTDFIEGVHYPPALLVEYGGISIETTGGAYSWNYDNEDGTNTTVEAVGENPFAYKGISYFSAGDEKNAKLVFGEGFNKYFISRWKVGEDYLEKEFPGYGWADENEEPLEHENGVFEISCDGSYIYEIWAWYESGDAYYYFRTDAPDEIGTAMYIKDVTSTGATVVFKQSGGNPTGELMTGRHFNIKDKDGYALKIAPEHAVFTDDAIAVPMGEVTEIRTDWEWLYGELEPGEYVIYKEVMDFRGTGDYDTKEFSVKFRVE